MKKLIILLVLLGLAVNVYAQSEPDVTVIPDNTRFNSRVIVERRSSNRTPSQSGAGSIWFNTSNSQWFGDTGTQIFNFGSGSGGTPTFGNQNANTVLSGPASGGPATPGFRVLVPADIPLLSNIQSGLTNNKCVRVSAGLLVAADEDCGSGSGAGTVTSFSSGNLSPLFTTSVSNPSTTPALSFSLSSQSQNLFLASPNGSSGTPTFRAIATADVPNLDAAKITSGTFDVLRIPDLDAAKIISGTFAAARIPALSALSGAVTDAQVPNLNTLGTGLSDGCVQSSGGNIISTGSDCGSSGGGGITSLNALTGATQAFANDTNIQISSSSSTHTLVWAGTLAAGRLNSNVVQAVTNDTNVTGSISAQTITLGWTGALAKARQHAATVYNDQANTFAAGFAQRFSGTVEGDAVTTAEITADQNDYAGCNGKTICRSTLDTNRTITSIASGGNWRSFRWINIDSTSNLILEHESASGTAANRINTSNGDDLIIGPSEGADCFYDNTSTRWRCFPLVVPLRAEADTLETVTGRGRVVTTANSFANSVRFGDGTDFWAVYKHASNGLQINCAPAGVEDDCHYIRYGASGKDLGFGDDTNTKRLWYTVGGQIKFAADVNAEASGLSLGSTTKAFQDLVIHGSGTYGSHSLTITGTPTGHRTITLPDSTTTLISADSTATFTNKTLDCEATGNNCTVPFKQWMEVAACQAGTAQLIWDSPSSNAPAATCDAADTVMGTADFDATTDETIERSWMLPGDWNSGALDVKFRWKAASISGAVGWCLQIARTADGATSSTTFAGQGSGNCVSDTAKGTTLQENDATITNVTCTSCASGDRLKLRISRDANGTAVTDDMTGDAKLIGIELTWRRTM